jgi:hypothetical protein
VQQPVDDDRRYDDASPEPSCLNVAASHTFVRGGSRDAEDSGDFLDGVGGPVGGVRWSCSCPYCPDVHSLDYSHRLHAMTPTGALDCYHQRVRLLPVGRRRPPLGHQDSLGKLLASGGRNPTSAAVAARCAVVDFGPVAGCDVRTGSIHPAIASDSGGLLHEPTCFTLRATEGGAGEAPACWAGERRRTVGALHISLPGRCTVTFRFVTAGLAHRPIQLSPCIGLASRLDAAPHD